MSFKVSHNCSPGTLESDSGRYRILAVEGQPELFVTLSEKIHKKGKKKLRLKVLS